MNRHNLKDDIGYWINRFRMQVHQSFEGRLQIYDISIAQWCILITLYNKDAASISELSKFIEVDKASISRVVDRLLLKDFVTHKQGMDRRTGHIQLTPKAYELLPFLIQAAENNEQQFFGCFTSEESEQLRQLFNKLFLNIPSIPKSGWLSDKTAKMNKDILNIIELGQQASFKGEMSFPQQVKSLIAAGIERYYIDLTGGKSIYYAVDGTTYGANLPNFNPPIRGKIFSEKEVIDALRAIQHSEILYPEFLNRIIKAGTVNYTVFLLGKQVHYTGAMGEIYIEHFPKDESK